MPESLLRRVRESSQPVEQPILDALCSALQARFQPPCCRIPRRLSFMLSPSVPCYAESAANFFAAPADAAGAAHGTSNDVPRGTGK